MKDPNTFLISSADILLSPTAIESLITCLLTMTMFDTFWMIWAFEGNIYRVPFWLVVGSTIKVSFVCNIDGLRT